MAAIPQPTSPTQNNFSFDKAVNAAETASNLTNEFIVSPIVNMGFAGFTFDSVEETTVDLESDITDHYTETNAAIQDNIALKPEIITLGGKVGELVYKNDEKKSTIANITEKISTINAFVPIITSSAKQARNFLQRTPQTSKDYFSQGVNTGVDLYQTFQTLNPPDTAQARAFNFFRSMWKAKQLVSLETPYTFYRNMAIMAIRATQPRETKYVTNFTITLKQVNFAATKINKYDAEKYQGKAKEEIAQESNKGKASGKKLDSIAKSKAIGPITRIAKGISNFF